MNDNEFYYSGCAKMAISIIHGDYSQEIIESSNAPIIYIHEWKQKNEYTNWGVYIKYEMIFAVIVFSEIATIILKMEWMNTIDFYNIIWKESISTSLVFAFHFEVH